MKISLKMTGCKNNRYELDKIQEWAVKNGVPMTSEDEADFSIINTCTVTHVADRKSRQLIRRTKNTNPKLKTIVFGCAARIQKKEFEKISEIDCLLPDLKAVLEFLEKSKNTPITRRLANVYQPPGVGADFITRSRALVQIQDGCDNFCSYCIIAAARGRSQSRLADEIIDEINKHVKHGYNEVVLTGINIGAYGCSNTTKPDESRLAELLEQILDKTDIKRVRLSSMGPEYFYQETAHRTQDTADKQKDQISKFLNFQLFDVLKNPRICRHIHLSVQSGSDSVLTRMRRNYSVKQMDEIIERLKREIPGIAVTADMIVGFPGETDKEFRETIGFIKRNKLAKVHIFPYSVRKSTLAAKMAQVPDDVKKKRARELQKIAVELRSDFIKSQTGKKASVLWKSNKEGLTDHYIRIRPKISFKARSISIRKIKKTDIVCN